ncbi:restriction endonuclease subunit S [Vibrio alginolyticus]|uniref:restriction endonuclease subunit S n=1 Tax=Vibrio alginolyticus TaxID=663 RepID=UPI002119F6EC|nr:restriction endonuclease subunit S [Vibrio alginolyticus]MCQ9104553.1 restriction endonuclease subunit S [Vibrio alginolyticus]
MTGRYKAYPEYKDSGVHWLHDIPTHWKTIPVGRCYRRVKRTGFEKEELLSVYRDHGVVPKSSRDDNNNKPSDDLSPYQLVCENNLVMNKMKAWQGSIAISEFRGIVSPAYFVYEPMKSADSLLFPKYVHYLLRHPIYITQYMSRSKGIRVNQWDLDPEEFQRIELLLPQKDEQRKIINFLDHETAKIDTLIAKQEKLIELLKEKRQAVISHAVTKGLNPQAPMKDSGVEWLGIVPEHWEISNLKYFASIQGGYAFNSNEFVDSGVQILRIGNVYQNRLALERQPTFVNDTLYNQLPDFRVTKGDILMSLTGTLGKRDYGFAVKVDLDGHYLLNQRVAKITPTSQKIIPSFLLNVLWSESYLTQLYSLPSGTKQANLSNSDVLRNIVAVPPSKEEQQEIALYVEEKLTKLDDLTKLATEAILLMKERKTALISAAVTGKIDVRDWEGDH